MNNAHFYEPAKGHGLKHDPMNAIIGPRPIGWISTTDAQGRLNLAPYSFFNLFSYSPPIVGFASTTLKDTVRNIEATGSFGWNLATRPLAEAMNQTSAMVAPEISEFELAGLTPVPSRLIKAPRVAESPVSFECQLTQIVPLKNAVGAETNGLMVFGEVVGVHIAQTLLTDGVYHTADAEPILRGGGSGDYFAITEAARFTMKRP
ncbi:flavin reductase family protein [Asticcacaulis tiandongensis]|uniref:flavin reductase family protein n=1 Tax=Asticcacaulis tiandongensis TaxID=2565365 RepID=UPI00112739C0|nr:flavin reductase family protein [Asticcacaulis tiandongensis]